MAVPLLGSEYVRWVQRSLNRIDNAGLNPDGQITPKYRRAVAVFQVLKVPKYHSAIVLYGSGHDLPLGQVDEPTQDTLMQLNYTGSAYVEWMQKALSKVGPVVPTTGVPDSTTLRAVKSFQSKSKLKDDGWVGPKTDTELVRKSGLVPPGSDHTPAPLPRNDKPWHEGAKDEVGVLRIFTRDMLKDFRESIEKPFLGIKPEFRMVYSGVLDKLTQPGVSNAYYITARKVDQFVTLDTIREISLNSLRPFLNNARDEVHRAFRWAFYNSGYNTREKCYKYFSEQVVEIVKAIDMGRDRIYKKTQNLGDTTPCRFLVQWLSASEADPRSIYSCFDRYLQHPSLVDRIFPSFPVANQG